MTHQEYLENIVNVIMNHVIVIWAKYVLEKVDANVVHVNALKVGQNLIVHVAQITVHV